MPEGNATKLELHRRAACISIEQQITVVSICMSSDLTLNLHLVPATYSEGQRFIFLLAVNPLTVFRTVAFMNASFITCSTAECSLASARINLICSRA